MKLKIGVLGGTFNPIHNGHINIANKIYNEFKLEKVLFLLNKIPPHKNYIELLSDHVRLEMLRKAIKDYVYFDIEYYELKKDSISYTYESLEYLKNHFGYNELFFIIGSDNLINFESWKGIDRIFKSAVIVVYLRLDSHLNDVLNLKKYYEDVYNAHIKIFLGEIINLSSTEIREKIIKNENIFGLVPNDVYDYIISERLYLE
ncbi:nicotinate-nucleotide adenylyltransferase [Candidatus Arthromitus sp. SFB-mouse-NYU]|uniref:nicotinate-nucleotide adenylyltransferase n=1 Tax=Candidatus Arthromitus sp. SFB-mouse-NL TaxID=1508644 RepID=UPI00022AE81E|nr:nicotinate-nucleotide adenylyltransferase [Candidatus Arthromitus sp. SFB-mouse-NL]EGX29122.1 nicotinate-nucleotide adenylyltransferase [Candidatus Arthromitus sp. SFB-mouse-NYU]